MSAYMNVGERWADETPGSATRIWTVTRVGQKKVHLRAEFPEFTATATAWIARIKVSPYWRCVDPAALPSGEKKPQ